MSESRPDMGKHNVLFIPCYNCVTQVTRVVNQLDVKVQEHFQKILFIDNGSQDGTLEKAIEAVSSSQVITDFVFLKNQTNVGLGGSHKVGFNFAINEEADYVAILHGDDQAQISDLLTFLQEVDLSGYDCLLGSRFMRESKLIGYSKIRTIGNIIFNCCFSLIFRSKISDLGSGLNLYRVSALKKLNFFLLPDDLTFNYAFLVTIMLRGLRVKFFPISWADRDQISNVRALAQVTKISTIIIKTLFYWKRFCTLDHRNGQITHYDSDIIHEISSKKSRNKK